MDKLDEMQNKASGFIEDYLDGKDYRYKIENTVLKRYRGSESEVIIPDGIKYPQIKKTLQENLLLSEDDIYLLFRIIQNRNYHNHQYHCYPDSQGQKVIFQGLIADLFLIVTFPMFLSLVHLLIFLEVHYMRQLYRNIL